LPFSEVLTSTINSRFRSERIVFDQVLEAIKKFVELNAYNVVQLGPLFSFF